MDKPCAYSIYILISVVDKGMDHKESRTVEEHMFEPWRALEMMIDWSIYLHIYVFIYICKCINILHDDNY